MHTHVSRSRRPGCPHCSRPAQRQQQNMQCWLAADRRCAGAALYASASGIVWAVLASFIKSVTDTLAADGMPAVFARGGVRRCHRRNRWNTAHPSSPSLWAAGDIPTVYGHCQSFGQHHPRRLALRRTLHRRCAEDRDRCLGLRRNGDRCRVPRAHGTVVRGNSIGVTGRRVMRRCRRRTPRSDWRLWFSVVGPLSAWSGDPVEHVACGL